MKQKIHNPKALLYPIVFGIVLFALYFAYWQFAVFNIKNEIKKQKPFGIVYSSLEFSGFPYHLTMQIRDFSKSKSNFEFHAKEISLTSNPFNPNLWVLNGALEPSLVINQLGLAKTWVKIAPTNFKASLRLRPKQTGIYQIAKIAIEFDNLGFSLPNGGQSPPIKNIGKTLWQILWDEKQQKHAFNFETNELWFLNLQLSDIEKQIFESDSNENYHKLGQFIIRGIITPSPLGEYLLDVKYSKLNLQNFNYDYAIGQLICHNLQDCQGNLKSENANLIISDLKINQKWDNTYPLEIKIKNSKPDIIATIQNPQFQQDTLNSTINNLLDTLKTNLNTFFDKAKNIAPPANPDN
jgi:hypothetical protein